LLGRWKRSAGALYGYIEALGRHGSGVMSDAAWYSGNLRSKNILLSTENFRDPRPRKAYATTADNYGPRPTPADNLGPVRSPRQI